MSATSDLDIFMDMMSDQESPFIEEVEQGKDPSYYKGLGLHILKQLDNKEHYFHFLTSILTNFDSLTKNQKELLKDQLCIVPETIIKEKIVFKEKIVYKEKNKKPKIIIEDY
jgi:hypothetical protein